jgi:predicted Zn-dependent peptidase
MKFKVFLPCRAIIFVFASIFGFASLTQAQQPTGAASGPAGQSVKGAELKNKAPINSQSLRIQLPKPIEAQLSNGVRVVLIEDHKLPTLFAQLAITNRGDGLDPADEHGLARATAAQLREGTATRTGQQLAEELDALGGTLSATTSTLDTNLSISGLSENTDALLSIFADVLLHPTFPQEELERYKARLLSQLQQQRAQPGFMAREQFNKVIYGDHPASVVAPSDDNVKRLASADLKAFHQRYYRPNSSWLFIAGDTTMQAMQPKLEKVLKEWTANNEQLPALPAVKPVEQPHVFVIDRPGSVQTTLLMGSQSIRGDDPDRPALSVMNQVFGGGPASRLFMNLREDKGYTYGAYSSVTVNRFPGIATANAEVRTEVTAGAMQEFMYEFKRIASEPVTAVELANAKRALVGRFALALEDPRSFIGYVFEQKIYNFPKDYWDHYAERIDAITVADVQRVAAKYLDPKRIQIVAVGDASKIKDVMKVYESN